MLAGLHAVPGGLDADEADAVVVEERMEDAHRVRAAADAGDHRIGQAAFLLDALALGFLADHGLEVAHQLRIGMRAGDGADDVEGILDIGDPVAHRLVQRILEGARAGHHRPHLGPISFIRNTLGAWRAMSTSPM